ncbi:MAG: CheY-P-specific phosphatase CheC [Fusobacteriia bacterium 4572_132]|nr:MAG: CheY-P-specific phosphatase CheC [Fusobacteriia bacterium 4572_132]
MSIKIEELNNRELDALKEVGNIGAGNAATALSQVLNKRIDMAVPRAKVLELSKVPEILGGAENLVVGVYLKIYGDIQGSIMFLLPTKSAEELIETLMGESEEEGLAGEISQSAIMEVGNILSSSYLNALSEFANLTVVPSTPALAYDMAGALFSTVLIELSEVSDYALLIETEFTSDGKEIDGSFFMLPDVDSLHILLKSIGVS